MSERSLRFGIKRNCLTFLFAPLVIAGVAWYMLSFWKKQPHYSAIFLDNDQVYFGQVVHKNNQDITIDHVYYLKANQETTDSARLALMKLGSELHSPTDRMVINRTHILFYETMTEEGVIMNAIKDYKK